MSLSGSSFIIKNDGTLWGCGDNSYNQLGLGDSTNRKTFTQITTNTNDIKSIYCGDYHTVILKKDGTLWGCGANGNYQLGLGDTTYRTIFTKITNDVKMAYCGYEHTIILKNDNTLWGVGHNQYGQLGLGNASHIYAFTKITNNVKSAYCGYNYTVVLKNDDTLWGCGDNGYGQLGLGDTNSKTILTKITANINDVNSIYCGYNHTIILQNNGTLWGCGKNNYGQLGLEDTNNRYTFTVISTNPGNIRSIHCGENHTIILKSDSTLWGCGDNSYGQLGLGDTNYSTVFTKLFASTNDIKTIYCGSEYTIVLKNDGTLWGCGYNNYGQLGLGDTTNRKTFTQITANANDIKYFANNYPTLPITIKIYDTKIGYTETLDTNNFRNIPIDKFEKIKVLYVNPNNTYLNCLISFDKKQTWKTFDGLNWNTISDISPENIILNGMDLKDMDQLDRNKLISGGLTGDLDFKIAMKTNNVNKTPSVTKIYIEYK